MSAILVSRTHRIAIVGDRMVRAGQVLPGGARVAAIERDRVVLEERDGARRVLMLNEGGSR